MNFEHLKSNNYYNTDQFSLNGIKQFCRIVDILDGDTLSVILLLNTQYYRFNIRLYGIDTCEIKSKNLEIHNKGIDAKNRIISLLCSSNKVTGFDANALSKKEIKDFFCNNFITAYISCKEFDKFGRTLADIYLYNEECSDLNEITKKENSLSYMLVTENLAYPYFGETKMLDDEIKEYFNLN